MPVSALQYNEIPEKKQSKPNSCFVPALWQDQLIYCYKFISLIFQFIDNLQLFSLLANVADVKSLVIHPATTTHSQLTDEELADQGIKQNTIRLSIGTEHIDDIIEDLERGFAALK